MKNLPPIEYDNKLRKNLSKVTDEQKLGGIVNDLLPTLKNRKDRLTVLVNNEFSQEKIVEYLKQGVNATNTTVTKFGEIENANWNARHRYLETIIDLAGYNGGADEFSTGSKKGEKLGRGYMLLQQNISIHTRGDTEAKEADPRIIEQ